MSDPRAIIVQRIDQSLDLLTGAPRMWGSPESMELQVLLLLEMRAVASRPHVMRGRPSGLRDAYEQFIRSLFPDAPPMMLSSILEHIDEPHELHSNRSRPGAATRAGGSIPHCVRSIFGSSRDRAFHSDRLAAQRGRAA